MMIRPRRWRVCKLMMTIQYYSIFSRRLPPFKPLNRSHMYIICSDETAMSANQAQGIIEYMPSLSKRKALRDFMKASNELADAKFERLFECKKFVVATTTVKQSRRKLKVLLFKLQFGGCIHDLAHGKRNIYICICSTVSILFTMLTVCHLISLNFNFT
jgi:hypothetical protein